jgi:glycerophosphoryl diester phosphodiesterase
MSHPSRSPLLIGHRGAPLAAPENTIESFRTALEAGIDGLELDLHRTSDGVLAVHHDPDVGGSFISELDWSELSSRAAGIPRFEQVLELLESFPEARLNIELKHAVPHPDEREVALARLLERWDGPAKRHAWISSFDPFSLVRLERLGVGLPLAALAARDEELTLLPCLPIKGVHPRHSLVTAERMAAWRERGLFVFVWTVNEPGLARELIGLGVDGLIGDDPALLLEARRVAGRSGAGE